MTLTQMLAEARFPLYAIRPMHWNGPAFVGGAARRQERLYQVRLTYEDDDSDRGAIVSNIEASSTADGLSAHVLAFVAHYDRDFAAERARRRRKAEPFPAEDFTQDDVVLAIGGQNAAVRVMRHKKLPLELMRAALRVGEGVTDLAVAGWRRGVRDLAPLVERVDVALAREFDRVSAP
jgi:hypothetical protein